MSQIRREEEGGTLKTDAPGQEAGLYVYCIALAGGAEDPGTTGIDGHQVWTVAHNGLQAAVHSCLTQPYQSSDSAVMASRVLAHHRVVEAAWRQWGTVLPMAFNTIVKGKLGKGARENLEAWLETASGFLQAKLNMLAGKAEYGVQVLWDSGVVAQQVARSTPEVQKLEEEIRAKPAGLAYMYRQRLQALLSKAMEAKASGECSALYDRLRRCVDDLRVEKAKGVLGGLRVLMNLSCLLTPERQPALEAELARVSTTEGFSARLVGPLPPYSFC